MADHQDPFSEIKRHLTESFQARVAGADSTTVITFEGPKTPGYIDLEVAGESLATRHFRNASSGHNGNDIKFEEGATNPETGQLVNGIRVSASLAATQGNDAAYTGWIAKVENGKVINQGPFSADIKPLMP